MANPFVYVQLQTQDLDKAKAFYGKLFDWKYDEKTTAFGPYVEIGVGQGTAGGMVGQRDSNTPSRWVPYVVVDDIDVTASQARALGGTIVQAPIALPNKSKFGLVMDPTGALFALHQAPPK